MIYGQGDKNSLSIEIVVSEDLQKDFKPDGRLFLFFEKYPVWEPRLNPTMGYGYSARIAKTAPNPDERFALSG